MGPELKTEVVVKPFGTGDAQNKGATQECVKIVIWIEGLEEYGSDDLRHPCGRCLHMSGTEKRECERATGLHRGTVRLEGHAPHGKITGKVLDR